MMAYAPDCKTFRRHSRRASCGGSTRSSCLPIRSLSRWGTPCCSRCWTQGYGTSLNPYWARRRRQRKPHSARPKAQRDTPDRVMMHVAVTSPTAARLSLRLPEPRRLSARRGLRSWRNQRRPDRVATDAFRYANGAFSTHGAYLSFRGRAGPRATYLSLRSRRGTLVLHTLTNRLPAL